MPQASPSPAIVVRAHGNRAFYEAKFRISGRQVKRRIGPAWLDHNPETGEWIPRRGRVEEGFFDARRAHVAAANLAEQEFNESASRDEARRARLKTGPDFREVAAAYLVWMSDVKGAKPSTLIDYRYMLREPGTPRKRGAGTITGHIMYALGGRPAAKISTTDIEALLARIAETGVSARTVNKHRALVSAIFNFGMKSSTFGLPANPAAVADKRREPHPGPLAYYRVEEVESLARALADGQHRTAHNYAANTDARDAERAEDAQDAEMVRISAYAGLRLGELLALRWRDVDFARQAITVGRAMSAGTETSTKSGRVRQVPLPDQAAAALERTSRRAHFTDADELIFCNALGRAMDPSALRRRYRRAQTALGLRPLRWHDLRHTYGSLLAAAGVDLVTIQSAMGHSVIATTGRYLHARPASDRADEFTRAFEGALAPISIAPTGTT